MHGWYAVGVFLGSARCHQVCEAQASGVAGGWFGKDKRIYHHTALVSVCYGMREALQIVGEEGLQSSWDNHERLHHKLWEGLNKLGLHPFVEDPKDRLATVNTIKARLASLIVCPLQPRSMRLQGLQQDNFCCW